MGSKPRYVVAYSALCGEYKMNYGDSLTEMTQFTIEDFRVDRDVLISVMTEAGYTHTKEGSVTKFEYTGKEEQTVKRFHDNLVDCMKRKKMFDIIKEFREIKDSLS